MKFDKIITVLTNQFGEDSILSKDTTSTPESIRIEPSKLLEVMGFLQADERLYFDSLSCLTAVDNGVESDSIELIYNLYSIPYDHHLMVKVMLDRASPSVDSLVPLWKTADWHEREAYDLMGINFNGHPDLRRILMPADWDGHPLRKDYEEQTYYRGVKVKY